MENVYLVRTAITERRAQQMTAAARRQARLRQSKGQLSVLMDRAVLEKWREYVKDRQEDNEPMSGAEILEELIERELRRKKRW